MLIERLENYYRDIAAKRNEWQGNWARASSLGYCPRGLLAAAKADFATAAVPWHSEAVWQRRDCRANHCNFHTGFSGGSTATIADKLALAPSGWLTYI